MPTVTIFPYKVYLVFYDEFKVVYKRILLDQKGKQYGSAENADVLLAVMLLHLTIEGLVTFCLRYCVWNIFWNNDRIRAIWLRYEEASLSLKMTFFKDIFFPFILPEGFRITKRYFQKSSDLRNKIVHGHELSKAQSSDGLSGGSELYKKLEKIDIAKYYQDFLETVMIFLDLLKKNPLPVEEIRPGCDWDKFVNEIRREICTMEVAQ